MAEGFINFTEGSGKKLRTFDRTIGANLTQEQYVIQGEQSIATYSAFTEAISAATAASHVLQLMAGSALNVRIKRITIKQVAVATTAAACRIEIVRLTTAGTGGTAITPAKADNGDAASGATAMSLPTVKGAEGAVFAPITFGVVAAVPPNPIGGSWESKADMKNIIIPAGTANGIALKAVGNAGLTLDVTIEFTETSFV
jgi:hypothetical protein